LYERNGSRHLAVGYQDEGWFGSFATDRLQQLCPLRPAAEVRQKAKTT